MAQPGRLGMTNVQKSELWQRWRNGESITDISRALGSFTYIGGVRLEAP
jgi:hypothetical protein